MIRLICIKSKETEQHNSNCSVFDSKNDFETAQNKGQGITENSYFCPLSNHMTKSCSKNKLQKDKNAYFYFPLTTLPRYVQKCQLIRYILNTYVRKT